MFKIALKRTLVGFGLGLALFGASTGAVSAQDTPAEAANKDLVLGFYQALNDADAAGKTGERITDIAQKYLSPDYVQHAEAFANLLPEARKYALGLVLAHQHVSQIEPRIFDAVLGNAGTVIAFRVGAQDAPVIARQLGDVEPLDLSRLPNHQAYIQLMIGGTKSRAFSMQTWPPAIGRNDVDVTGGSTLPI